jgi:uncharacterized surface protein with fasciclin (FAS1) repeats
MTTEHYGILRKFFYGFAIWFATSSLAVAESDLGAQIRITVRNNDGTPIRSTISLKSAGNWQYFGETDEDGQLVKTFLCEDNHFFKAEPFDRGFYRSDSMTCAKNMVINVSAKPRSIAKNTSPNVGGAPMFASKNIVENAVNSKDHTTLVAAVKAAGLVETLMSAGPFTVFAPTNAAFAKLPAGTAETLVNPENKDTLTSILTYHVVVGKMTAADLAKAIKVGGGKASLTTVNGGTLTIAMVGKKLVLTDAKGGKSTITIANVMQSNGVIHVVDTVVLP